MQGTWRSDRVKSAIGVAAFHALLGYALVTGLGIDVSCAVADRLKVFDVAPEPPPPPPVEEVVAVVSKTKAPEGAASPPNLKAQPSPIVAPPPEIRLEVPPPIVAAPKAGLGNDSNAGASTIIGPGTGAGGIGNGTGSGGQGSGTGGGGVAVGARLLRGGFSDRDYPRAARRVRAQGTVIVRYTVGPDGRVNGCAITRSSGNADLDATTCQLIERRYRYAPAKDSQGRPVPDLMGWKQVWWIERGGRSLPPEEALVDSRDSP